MKASERYFTVFGPDRLGEIRAMTPLSAQDIQAGDLREVVNNSEAYAIECDGEIEAIIGLQGGIVCSNAKIWMVFTPYAGLGTVRFLKREFPRKLREFNAIYTFTNPLIPRVEAFTEFMGFKRVGVVSPGYTVWRASSECRH